MLLGLNLLLVLVLALASAYLYLRYNPDLIRSFAENLVREELDDNGLEFSLNSMEIHSLHDIRARNLTLREKAKPGKLAELREIRIDDIRKAAKQVRASVTRDDIEFHEDWNKKHGALTANEVEDDGEW